MADNLEYLEEDNKYICMCGSILKKSSRLKHLKSFTHQQKLKILSHQITICTDDIDPDLTETEEIIKSDITIGK